MSKAEEVEKFPRKAITELNIGDSVFTHRLVGWQFLLVVPEDVAQWWTVQHFPECAISTRGHTPSGSPIKTWEVGIGIVVATPLAFPGEERLCLLHKTGEGDFRLYLSRASREVGKV